MGSRDLKKGLPLGSKGLDTNNNYFDVDPRSLSTARNAIFQNSVLTRSLGISEFDSTGIGSHTCYGGVDWNPTSSLQYQVTAWSNGELYRSGSGDVDATTLATSQSYTEPVIFVKGGKISSGDDRDLLVFSKDVRPQKIVGTATSSANFTADASDWSSNYPGAAVFHDARVYAYDQDGQEDVFWASSLSDHSDFSVASGARAGSVAKGQGERIKCMFSYQGTLLLVLKDPGVYVVDTTNVVGFSLPAYELRPDVGGAGPLAITKVGQDILFVSSDGRLLSLRALGPDQDPSDADITEQFNLGTYIDEYVDKTRLKWAQLIYNPNTKVLYYYFTSKFGSGDVNDMGFIINLEDKSNPRFTVEDRGDYFNAAWSYKDSNKDFQIYVGGDAGTFYNINSDNRSVDGAAFTTEIQIAESDLSWVDPALAGRDKHFEYLELSLIPTGDIDLTIDFLVDGANVISRTISLSSPETAWDSAIFDTDTFADTRPIPKRVPIKAWGETISFKITTSGVNENFKLINYNYIFGIAEQTYEA